MTGGIDEEVMDTLASFLPGPNDSPDTGVETPRQPVFSLFMTGSAGVFPVPSRLFGRVQLSSRRLSTSPPRCRRAGLGGPAVHRITPGHTAVMAGAERSLIQKADSPDVIKRGDY